MEKTSSRDRSHTSQHPRVSRRFVLKGAAATTALASAGCQSAHIGSLTGIDYHQQDAMGLADLVRTGQVSASELLEEAIGRAIVQDKRLNFLAQEMFDYGRKQIAQGLPEGPFKGVPFLEKDLNMHIAGVRSGQGSRLFDGYIASVTSELVKRHEAAGLVIFGKTTTPEFGLTGTTESIAEGATRNPWNLAYSSGGSSGGASAAVASGVVPMAHASDGGGSIRIPASACGLFGLKPSRGRIPLGPGRTEGWGGMSTNGAVSRSVRDTAALLDATHGPEPGSRYTAPNPSGTFLSQVKKSPGKLKIALMLDPISGTAVDPEVIHATRRVALLCEDLGHHVEEASFKIDAAKLGAASFAIVSTGLANLIDARAAEANLIIGPEVLEPVTLALYNTGKQTSGMAVAAGSTIHQNAAITVAEFMQRYDLILSPVMATPPTLLGRLGLNNTDFAAFGKASGAYIPFTSIFNVTGQPSMSVPLNTSKSGLPIGAMFSARYGEEAVLLKLAGQLENAEPWFQRSPPSI